MEMKLIYSPWMNRFLTAVSKAEKEILLVSPFVKMSLVEPMLMALPDTGIDLCLITRFSSQNFQQLSSDFSALQLLRHRPFANGPTRVYKLNRLHAKVYIFDRRFIFIGSSNLSVSGFDRNLEMAVAMEDPQLAEQIYADLESHGALGMLLESPHFEEMRTVLRIPSSTIIVSEDAAQSVEDNEGSIEQVTIALPEPQIPIEPSPTAPDYESRQKKLNDFIAAFLRADLNEIGGIPFESPFMCPTRDEAGKPITEELERRHAAAKRDIDRIKLEVLPSLGLPEKIANSEAALVPFVHQSWCNNFPDVQSTGLGNEIFSRLGRDVVWLELALFFARQIAFDPISAGSAAIAAKEAARTIDYEAFLNAKGLNVLLHIGNLQQKASWEQVSAALGLVCFYRRYSDARQIVWQLIDERLSIRKISEITDDPKTRLQETLHAFGSKKDPVYITNRTGGTDHEPEFSSQVRFGSRSFGPVAGTSKKSAEMSVANLALAALQGEGRPVADDLSSQAHPIWRRYELSEKRRAECNQLANKLGLKYDHNVVLLDLALTHISYLHEHPQSRSYQRLAFVGSMLTPLLVCFHCIRDYGWKGQDAIDTLARQQQVLNLAVLTKVFDCLNLETTVQLVKSLEKALLSGQLQPSMKKDIVQSILATAYLWGGFGQALTFWDRFVAPMLDKAGLDVVDTDPMGLFQRISHSKFQLTPRYQCARIGGTDNKPRFMATVYLKDKLVGSGEGNSKKEAEKEAAKAGLKKVELEAEMKEMIVDGSPLP